MIIKIIAWLRCHSGATAVEYGLIAGGISLAIVASLFAFGDQLSNLFDLILTPMDSAATRVSSGI